MDLAEGAVRRRERCTVRGWGGKGGIHAAPWGGGGGSAPLAPESCIVPIGVEAVM